MATADPTTPETWKDIPEYTGYQASNRGQIRSFWKQGCRSNGLKGEYYSFVSLESRILATRKQYGGYRRVNLRHDSGVIHVKAVGILVLKAFVGPCPDGMVCCHNDGCPTNNHVENLRWDTQKENISDAGRHGTKKVLSSEQIAEIVRLSRENVPFAEIAKRFHINPKSVSRVLLRLGIRTRK